MTFASHFAQLLLLWRGLRLGPGAPAWLGLQLWLPHRRLELPRWTVLESVLADGRRVWVGRPRR